MLGDNFLDCYHLAVEFLNRLVINYIQIDIYHDIFTYEATSPARVL